MWLNYEQNNNFRIILQILKYSVKCKNILYSSSLNGIYDCKWLLVREDASKVRNLFPSLLPLAKNNHTLIETKLFPSPFLLVRSVAKNNYRLERMCSSWHMVTNSVRLLIPYTIQFLSLHLHKIFFALKYQAVLYITTVEWLSF